MRRELTSGWRPPAAVRNAGHHARPPPRLDSTAHDELIDAADGFLRRSAIAASLTREERVEILRGMVLTRATDNRLKTFFTAGEIKYGATSFQGKGFRSLGQEAIYAAAIRLRRGARSGAGRPLDRRRHRAGDPRSRSDPRDAS